MSLATSIKDFADLLTEIYTTRGYTGDFPKALLLQQTFIYSLQALISLLLYLFSFQWLRDISYLPLYTPQIENTEIFGRNLFANPASYIFSFSSIPKQATDQLFAGLVNSFFFSLPVSLPHLVGLRRLFFQGPAAAAASLMGLVTAHSLFLVGVVYGYRFLIIPYFSLEPLNYIIGVLIVAVLVKDFAQQKTFKLVPFWDKRSLIKMAVFTFLLTWCEETSLFHSFNHLTLNAQNTYFDLYPCSSALNCFVVHTTYVLAFFVGHSFFSAFFYYLLLMASRYLSSLRWFTTAMVTLRLSKIMLFLIVAFTLSSFPYYGLDYLLTNLAGFLPEDPVYTNTFLSPTKVKTKYPHFFKEIPPAQRDQKTPLNLDLNYFDRGMYLNAPKQVSDGHLRNKRSSVNEALHKSDSHKISLSSRDEEANKSRSSEPPTNAASSIPLPALTFEELNYQGEYAWIMRNQLSKDLSKMRPSVFTPIFKKPRRRYLQLRKLNDNKMEEAAQMEQNKKAFGNISEPYEGTLPNENASLFIKIPEFLGRALFSPYQGLIDEQESRSVLGNDKNEVGTQIEADSIPFGRSSSFATAQHKNDRSSSHSFMPNRSKKPDPIKEELAFERKVQKTYSKGFSPPFSLAYERMRYRSLPVKNVIKKRYFLNNVYKSLLEVDIDAFLARQPAVYKLAENQEFQLYKKRQMLQKYYNWLRYYQPFEKTMKLNFQIPDSKSFVDRVYHQQFKGTLKIARRLFKVSFDDSTTFMNHQSPESNPTPNKISTDVDSRQPMQTQSIFRNGKNAQPGRILSYDQMLYNTLSHHENPILHEELLNLDTNVQSETHAEISRKGKNNSGEQAFVLDLPAENFDTPSSLPFIEESTTSPTYAGWDSASRRFVVTNRFLVKAFPALPSEASKVETPLEGERYSGIAAK